MKVRTEPGINHISYTQLNMLLRCPEQWRRRYECGEIIPPSGAKVRGRTGHRVEEKNFIQKKETHVDLPLEAVRDFFSDEFEASKYEIEWTPEELQEGGSILKLEAKYKDSGIGMVSAYHSEIAPLVQPMHIELEFKIGFEGGYPDLTGFIDRIDRDGSIVDLKFVSKSPSDDIQNDIQMSIYDLAYRTIFKNLPTKIKKEFAIGTKVPKTKIQECEPRDVQTLDRLLFRVEKAMEVLKAGVFAPAPIGAWWCNPQYCGYYRTCKYRP